MTKRLDDRISLETLRKRWIDSEKNDPFKTVVSYLRRQDYDALARILRKEPELNPRQVAAIPAALVHIRADYQRFFEEMRTRNAADVAAYCIRVAYHIAGVHNRKRNTLRLPVRGRNPLPRSGREEYERMFELYCT